MTGAARTYDTPAGAQSAAPGTGFRFPPFEMPKFETSDEFRDLFEQSCTNFAKGSAEVSTKVIELMTANTNSQGLLDRIRTKKARIGVIVSVVTF